MEKYNKEFLELYDKYADVIFRHCYLRVYNRELAQDLAQEVFLRIWRYETRGNTITNMRAFLYRTARNLIIDEYKKQKKILSLDRMEEERRTIKAPEEGSDILKKIDAKNAAASLKNLEDRYREVITLRYIDELSVKEIAEILSESENTVSVRIHRGLQRLKKMVSHYD
ncbi:MAG: RNA polymerase sigma factor [Candidatus Yanofskybacteria bacterium]|nr:RNA polymerase sigma factor [Candidatus Yanofskybacteria bacterium]